MQLSSIQGLPKVKFVASAVNVVCDGNSLTNGYGASIASKKYPTQLVNFTPLVGSGITAVNLGINGQTWRMMNGLDGGSATDVDGAFDGTKAVNILIIWETTNAIWGGRTAAQVIQDTKDYINARLAAHPSWKIILLTSLPRRGTTAQNQALVDVDNYFRANYRAMGASVLVDVRADGSPFNFFGDADAPFLASQSLWYETSTWVHLNDTGYGILARMVGQGLQRVPAR